MKNKLTIAVILASLSSPVYAGEVSLIKPIAGYHFSDRNHPQGYEWNEDFTESLGVSFRSNVGLGASITYVASNSVNENALFIHGEYIPTVWEQGNHSVNFGLGVGVRSGYPHKASNRTKSDFIPSGAFQAEYCYKDFCPMVQVVPYTKGVAVFGLRYKF